MAETVTDQQIQTVIDGYNTWAKSKGYAGQATAWDNKTAITAWILTGKIPDAGLLGHYLTFKASGVDWNPPTTEEGQGAIEEAIKDYSGGDVNSPPSGTGALGLLWWQISQFFEVMFGKVASAIGGYWRDEVIPSVRNMVGLDPEKTEKGFGASLDAFVKQGLLDAEGAEWIKEVYGQSKIMGAGASVAFSIALVTKMLTSSVQVMTGDFFKVAMAKFSPNVPSVDQLLKPMLMDYGNDQQITALMRQNGFSEEDVKLLKMNAYALFDSEHIKELYLRKIIDQNRAIHYLTQIGYKDFRIEEMMQTWEIIPGPQDLLFMVGKESFEPDQIKLFGLDEEFPEAQVEWLEKQGLSRFWAEKYWYAHWTQVPLEMGFEMLHRGIIDRTELNGLFRAQEIPAYWRERLVKMAYHPYTRIDVRRMYAAGVLTEEEVMRSYLDLPLAHLRHTYA